MEMKKISHKFPNITRLYQDLDKYVRDNTTNEGFYFGDAYSYKLFTQLREMVEQWKKGN